MGRAEDRLQWADIDSPVSVTFRAGLNEDVVSQQTRNTLQDIGLRSRVWNIDITSTARNAEQQATAMYNNAVRDVDEQLRTYRAPGQAVIRVFQAAQERELGRAATIQLMTEEINRQGPGNVSRHAADPDVLNVIDISQRTMPNNLHDAFRTEAGEETGVRVLDENNVFHLEVEQDQPDGN